MAKPRCYKCSDAGTGWPGGPLAPPIFGRSVHPILTGEGRLSPPITTATPKMFSPSSITEIRDFGPKLNALHNTNFQCHWKKVPIDRWQIWNHREIYFKTNSVLSWPSNRRRCKQWSEGRTSSNDFYFTQRTSIGLQISNQQGAIKMIKRIKWHHVEHHLLRWSRKGAINTYISSAHVRDGAWGPIGPGGPVGEPWRWEEVDYLFLYRNVGRFENPEDIICLPPIWLE